MASKWYQQLQKSTGEQRGLRKLKLSEATFSNTYQNELAVSDALYDLDVLATMGKNIPVRARLVQIEKHGGSYSVKLYTLKDSIPLSQSMPILESMGLYVLVGRPYRITLGRTIFWIHHFTLDRGESICDVDSENIPRYFSELFESVWHQRSENDAFNHLLFNACIEARNIQIIRAYVVYMNQIRVWRYCALN